MKEFQHEDFGRLRVVRDEGEWWLFACDVCQGMNIDDTIAALRWVDSDDIRTICVDGREPRCIRYAGLLALVHYYHNERTKAYKRWVAGTVLPNCIEVEDILREPGKAADVYLLYNRKKQQEGGESASAEVAYDDGRLYKTAQIARWFGFSPQKLNRILVEMGIQHPYEGDWTIDRAYADCGYISMRKVSSNGSDGYISRHWTLKGARFVVRVLREAGYPCRVDLRKMRVMGA